MDPNPCATSEESELKEFNDPFEVVSESFVRQRHSEIDSKPLSIEDEQLLVSLMDAGGIEGNILTDAFTKLVSMQYVPKEIAVQVQEGFEFEKLDFNAVPGLSSETLGRINLQAAELELEELIMLVESGQDEDGKTLTEAEISDIEKRILVLDAQVRPKNRASAKDT